MHAVGAQSSSDLTDRQHLSPRPWYLERSCSGLRGQDGVVCIRGKAEFAVAVACMLFYFVRSIGSVLRLAYWCGEYGVLDMCADRIGKYWAGSRRENYPSRHFTGDDDRQFLAIDESPSVCTTCVDDEW